ncbi:anaerobic ribonucleoside-triphosphate reductase activating protein [Pelosinus propionicus]|uniref:Anaerobic ribonucleoside-triphosphate reductase-activating protein n=1 Tax=Pelosinus propionicus DSM 13327 TaxID=1123291 RepID=A0A1I4NPX2_9FIRM|nr:anaerobic ribonucleoside-triphosphate reductase activating protein [Pelosinus propionicus]SFM17574.1 anaerobic ribonucleoside-triphosphate reductase activating protein [Pelosinus propionicus DSM 13327]
MVKIRLASPITTDSVVDGKGLRTVIWCQGCTHHCQGCHNADTQDLNGGFEQEINDLVQAVLAVELQSGVTFSGGEPMLQPVACTAIAEKLKSRGVNIWCYTGFTFEELLNRPDCLKFLQYIDVLIDGKFELALKSYDLLFKGSANQRIIDVSESLKEKKVVLYEPLP